MLRRKSAKSVYRNDGDGAGILVAEVLRIWVEVVRRVDGEDVAEAAAWRSYCEGEMAACLVH